jgi:hypothetical protein
MKIIENAKKVQRALLHDVMVGGDLAVQLQKKAVLAIRGGKDSAEWKEYMAIFADNEEQLQRLLGNDPAVADQTWFLESTAYLVSNGVCTSPSAAHFINDVNPQLDDGLDPTPGEVSTDKALDITDPHPEIPLP